MVKDAPLRVPTFKKVSLYRKCLKSERLKSELFGNPTVIECLISTLHILDFRHLLYFPLRPHKF